MEADYSSADPPPRPAGMATDSLYLFHRIQRNAHTCHVHTLRLHSCARRDDVLVCETSKARSESGVLRLDRPDHEHLPGRAPYGVLRTVDGEGPDRCGKLRNVRGSGDSHRSANYYICR